MPERATPLLILVERLGSLKIPSLSSLIAQIADAESYADFVKLVKTYLPEREQDILREPTPAAQIARFASHFEDRYFPLDDRFKLGDIEGYTDLTYHIPVIVMGFSYDDYHELDDARPGAQLMTYLIENPWEEGGMNVSLAEACREHVPGDLLERAGEIRLSLDQARALLKSTRYEPVMLWAERLYCDTGNFFLDTDYEMLWSSGDFPEWDPETVENLTRHWHQAEQHENEVGDFMEWLERDLIAHFEELVSFIERRRDEEEAPG